jgi:hypothetical protein
VRAVPHLAVQRAGRVGPTRGAPIEGAASKAAALLVLFVVLSGDVDGVGVWVLASDVPAQLAGWVSMSA